jgi:hypothetical protein
VAEPYGVALFLQVEGRVRGISGKTGKRIFQFTRARFEER